MVSIRGHASRWGAYAALGITLVLLGQVAAANPKDNHASGYPQGAPAQQGPAGNGAPRPAAPVDGVAQRIAAALETKNTYDQSAKQQKYAADVLAAEQSAARWAGWLFGAAVFETWVTALGVLLVFFTLRAAQRSADEAKRGADEMKRTADATIADQRPWLAVMGAKIVNEVGFVDAGAITIEFTLTNTGRTPAMLNFVVPDFTLWPIVEQMEECFSIIRGNLEPASGKQKLCIFPGQTVPFPIGSTVRWEYFGDKVSDQQLVFEPFIYGEMLHGNAGKTSTDRYRTAFCFQVIQKEIWYRKLDNGTWQNLPNHMFTIRPWHIGWHAE